MNAMADERFQSNRSVLNFKIRSFICVPLLLPDRAIGTLYVDNRKLDSVFDEPDARFLMAYGGFAAAAVENARNEGRLRQSVKRLEVEARGAWHPGQIVGSSPAMRRVLDLARKVGPREATVLLRGESGTGKELIARLLHDLSPRKDAPFVAVNCAALPGPLVESELFGVARGAATDVVERPGKFEEANGGTIFLDEIGDLALEAQSKILRAVQERCVERLGSHRTVPLDIRLIAATHTDLEAAMLAGRFREDLYYRLNVVPITLPPLRERPEDVAALVRHYVDRFCTAQSKPTLGIRDEAMRSYTDHEWPGNVRELKNAVERGVLLSDGEWLPPLERPSGAGRDLVTSLEDAYARGLSERELKRIYAGYVYERLQGSKSRACELLDIDFKTLRTRLD
jgi:transcriptional regulator with GAF, ATPase, and Fis domain